MQCEYGRKKTLQQNYRYKTYNLLQGRVYHDAGRQDNVGFEEQRNPLPFIFSERLNFYPLIILAAHLLDFIAT
jgi:hypothetical protein